MYSVYSFSSFFGGLAFLGRINTRVYAKLLPQYQATHKCAVPTKPIFHHSEQVKVELFEKKGVPQVPWIVSTTVRNRKKYYQTLYQHV